MKYNTCKGIRGNLHKPERCLATGPAPLQSVTFPPPVLFPGQDYDLADYVGEVIDILTYDAGEPGIAWADIATVGSELTTLNGVIMSSH